MRRLHLAAGVLTLLVFVGTGAYMRWALDGLHGLQPGERFLYRSRHIYILAAALLHLALGSYLVRAEPGWRARLQLAGSVLLLAAPVLLFWAFAREPRLQGVSTPVSQWGIFALAGGTLAHAVSRARRGAREAA